VNKKRKTRWERKMRRLQIGLIVVLPVLFGLVLWLAARLLRSGP
jgi:uncharacterized BrkB/YihY/UPF0761 family membrane protein